MSVDWNAIYNLLFKIIDHQGDAHYSELDSSATSKRSIQRFLTTTTTCKFVMIETRARHASTVSKTSCSPSRNISDLNSLVIFL